MIDSDGDEKSETITLEVVNTPPEANFDSYEINTTISTVTTGVSTSTVKAVGGAADGISVGNFGKYFTTAVGVALSLENLKASNTLGVIEFDATGKSAEEIQNVADAAAERGSILILTGNVILTGDLTFNGITIIEGALTVNGGSTLTTNGYVHVEGQISVENGATVNIHGAMSSSNAVDDNGTINDNNNGGSNEFVSSTQVVTGEGSENVIVESGEVIITFEDLLKNDTDANGDTLEITGITIDGITYNTDTSTINIEGGTINIDWTNGTITVNSNESIDFTYNIADGNGGTNVGNVNVGIATENNFSATDGSDVIQGGTVVEGQNYNMLFIMDDSSSLTTEDRAASVAAITTQIESLNEAVRDGSIIEVGVIVFSDMAENMATITLPMNAADLEVILTTLTADIKDSQGGATNYQDAFIKADEWFEPRTDAGENKVIFITDGVPSRGNDDRGQAAGLKYGKEAYDDFIESNAGVTVDAIGVGNGINNTTLSNFDTDGQPTFIENYGNLSDALSSLNIQQADTIFAAKGDDIVFGDSVMIGDKTLSDYVKAQLSNPDATATQIVEYTQNNAVEIEAIITANTNAASPDRDDIIVGGGGNDVVFGVGGNDVLIGDGSNASADGNTADKLKELAGLSTDTNPEELSTALNDADAARLIEIAEGMEKLETISDGNDQLFGGAGNDVIFGMGGDDYIDGGAGNDKIFGGSGDDTIVFDQNDSYIDGGSGHDTLKILAGQDIDFSKIENIKNIEEIDLSAEGENRIELTAQDVLDMTDDSNEIKITGTDEDEVTLAGGSWKEGGSEDGYTIYTAGDDPTVTVKIQDTIDVII